MKKISVVLIILGIILLTIGIYSIIKIVTQEKVIENFQDCVEAENRIISQESELEEGGFYPDLCVTENGDFFVDQEGLDQLDERYSCTGAGTCVPLPSECHPKTSINQRFRNEFQAPEFCTMLYDNTAAYEKHDCRCIDSVCVNLNIANPIEDIQNTENTENTDNTETTE